MGTSQGSVADLHAAPPVCNGSGAGTSRIDEGSRWSRMCPE